MSGDMADYDIEQGMDALVRHRSGDCGPDRCQYCEEEQAARDKRSRAKAARRRRKEQDAAAERQANTEAQWEER